jgi:hypothetical protein
MAPPTLVGHLYIPLTVSCSMKNIFGLEEFHLFVFAFVSCALGVLSKKIFVYLNVLKCFPWNKVLHIFYGSFYLAGTIRVVQCAFYDKNHESGTIKFVLWEQNRKEDSLEI